MIDLINQVNEIGWSVVFVSAILLLLIGIAIKELFKKALETFGLKTNSSIEKEQMLERIGSIEKEIETLKTDRIHDKEQLLEIQKQLKESQNEIKESLDNLKKMIIKKDIDDMRWDILDFGSGIISDRKYSKEQYDHVFEVYQDYERVLEENNMENGRVDMSMTFIKKKYEYLLENGFDA